MLVNGNQGPPIYHAHGLRQGDSISPLLFAIVTNSLNSLLQHAVSTGMLRHLTTRHATSSISLFADDVVIFCHADTSDLATIHKLLCVFGDASGLRTNFLKCLATPICCAPEASESIAAELSCPVSTFPIQYLGLPLSIRKIHDSALLLIVDKMTKKLATWKASLLSHSERVALVRHVLTAMPVHILLAMAMNPKILKKITMIVRDFRWHGCKDARARCCPISWPKICRPLELGGLAIRDLHRTGIALRARWLWLQATDPTRPGVTFTYPKMMKRASSSVPPRSGI